MAGDDVRLADVVVIDGHDYHTFQPLLYTLADAVRLTEHILERWEAADKDPALIEDGALNVVAVGGEPTGVESVGAIAELYRAIFVKDYPDIQQDKAQIVLVEGRPEDLHHVQAGPAQVCPEGAGRAGRGGAARPGRRGTAEGESHPGPA